MKLSWPTFVYSPGLSVPLAKASFSALRAALAGALLASSSFATTVLLNDSFADDSRTNQALPASAAWTYSADSLEPRSASLIRYTRGDELQLIRADPAQGSFLAAYFTAPGGTVALADGDSIALSFTLRLGSAPNSADAFRFGLFNSMGATRPTLDMTLSTPNPGDSRFLPAQGYGLWMNVGATSPAAFNLYKRDTTNASIPFNAASNLLLGANNTDVLAYPLNQKVTHSMVITRVGNALSIIATVNGRTLTRIDPSPTNDFAFDMIGIYNAPGLLTSALQPAFFDDFVVEYRPVGGGDAGRVTILRDEFSDGNRSNQALPESAQWFFKGSNTAPQTPATQFRIPAEGFTFANENRDLILTDTGSAATLTAPFTASAPVTLAVGDSLTARFSLNQLVLRDAEAGLRIGLFDSRGSRPAADFTPATGSTPANVYAGYVGYSVWFNPSPAAPAPVEFRARSTAGPALFGALENAPLGTAPLASQGLSVGQFTRASFKLTRIAESALRIESAYNGTTRVEDVTATNFSFDTFGLHVADNASEPGEALRLDDVTILYTPAAPTKVTNPSTLLSEDFVAPLAAWSASSAVGTPGVSGAVAIEAAGTIDAIMGVKPSDALVLRTDASGATGTWKVALQSGLLPVSNSLTDRALLTLAFDLNASSARPVVVALESFDAGGEKTGRIETMVYPAAPNTWQRFAFELDSAQTAEGTFDPTAPGLRLSFEVHGGTGAFVDWANGDHTLVVDNVHYARPAYYVKPDGNNNADGRTPDTAFATPAKAVAEARAGDIVVFMSDPGRPDADFVINNETQLNSQGIYITESGRPAGWITFKNYPGQRPRIKTYGWRTFGVGSNAPLYSAPVGYIEFRGLSLSGAAKTSLAESYRGQVIGVSNTNGIEVQGRNLVNTPHHVRIADNLVFDAAGGGIIVMRADYIQIENNVVYDTCFWTRYAGSGISILASRSWDTTKNTYRNLVIGNEVFGNESREPWEQINALSDGNGIIIDSLQSAGEATYGSFSGRTLVQNNLAYDNGGGGIHVFRSDGVDIINNTAYGNNQIVNYGQITHSASGDGTAINNILVSTDGKTLTTRSESPLANIPSAVWTNNLYVRGAGSPAPTQLPGDSGNVVIGGDATDVFVAPGKAPGSDFRLKAGSPAVGFGVNTPLVPVLDFAGLPRAVGGGVDAGAFARQPVLLASPAAAVSVLNGQTLTLAVTALGEGLAYQWYFNGEAIAGATAATLQIPNSSAANTGEYFAVISGPGGNTVTTSVSTVTIQRAPATLTLGSLNARYDGTPKAVTALTVPAGLNVTLTYNGSTTAPVYPGTYAVTATIDDANYEGTASGTLTVGITATVRHAPVLNGDVTGSVQVLLPESITFNSGALLSADLLVPGLPTVVRNGGGSATLGSIVEGPGAATPTSHQIILNSGSALGRLIRRIDAIGLPVVAVPPAPVGTRNVVLNQSTDPIGSFSTLRNLTLNSGAGEVALPAGTYGSIVLNNGTTLTLGQVGAVEPAVYNVQGFTLNGASSKLRVVGPVVLTLAQGLAANGTIGEATRPDWLRVRIAAGGLTLNSGVSAYGAVIAPSGTVLLNSGATLTGSVAADRLTLNSDALLTDAP